MAWRCQDGSPSLPPEVVGDFVLVWKGTHKLPGHYVSYVASGRFHSTACCVVSFCVGVCRLCCFCLVGAFSCFLFGDCPLFPCGMTLYDLTPRVFKAVTASALLAVIKTASKHLHNDLARATVATGLGTHKEKKV